MHVARGQRNRPVKRDAKRERRWRMVRGDKVRARENTRHSEVRRVRRVRARDVVAKIFRGFRLSSRTFKSRSRDPLERGRKS